MDRPYPIKRFSKNLKQSIFEKRRDINGFVKLAIPAEMVA